MPTMGDTPAAKFQSHLEIKTLRPPSPPTRPFSLSKNQDREHQKTPFFKSRAGIRKSDTWIISVFVILHVVAFIATMVANDCWRNSHGDCALKALGRLSFQPLPENPLLGPSASASVSCDLASVTTEYERWCLDSLSSCVEGTPNVCISFSETANLVVVLLSYDANS
ncbi:hypothetical protein Pint_08267 [Pistacia integerrima]|uniref:Uncharacterized protein n=1 Tax=Pistacia integerrima TaxID=434235 RepID=A0ACC0XUL9_9ROSI|nr:hypothetical protein Pint_08267 [Pistacia integerrima]